MRLQKRKRRSRLTYMHSPHLQRKSEPTTPLFFRRNLRKTICCNNSISRRPHQARAAAHMIPHEVIEFQHFPNE